MAASLSRICGMLRPDFAPVATAPDDAALIAFTSGTTGKPKGCVHFHRDIAAMAETFSRQILQPKSTDIFCGTPPFAFTFGLGAAVVFPASCGAATALPDKPGFDALADTIAKHKVTTLFTSPTGYRALMKIYDQRLALAAPPASRPASICRLRPPSNGSSAPASASLTASAQPR